MRAGKTAGKDFAHHGKVIARCDVALDVKFTISVFHKAFRPGNDHAADHVGTLNMAVIVNFNAFGRAIEVEFIGQAIQQFALRCAFSQAATQRLAGIGHGVLDQITLATALGHMQLNLVAIINAQGFFDQFLTFDVVA